VTTFLLPAVILALSLFRSPWRAARWPRRIESSVGRLHVGRQAIGYVDIAGVIEQIPEPPKGTRSWQVGPLQEYPTEAAAQAALDTKEIAKYYIVPADFIESGDLIVVDSNFSVFNSLENNDYFEYVLRLNLVKDANLAELLDDPTAKVESQGLAPQVVKKDEDAGYFGVPFAC